MPLLSAASCNFLSDASNCRAPPITLEYERWFLLGLVLFLLTFAFSSLCVHNFVFLLCGACSSYLYCFPEKVPHPPQSTYSLIAMFERGFSFEARYGLLGIPRSIIRCPAYLIASLFSRRYHSASFHDNIITSC